MKKLIIGLIAIICLAGCKEKSKFSINEDDMDSKYSNNQNFKHVYKRAYYYYFKGGLRSYYGINMKDKDIFSGYIVFMGPNAPLCFSYLNYKGRKTFNKLVTELKNNRFIKNNSIPNEDLGKIEYSSSDWSAHAAEVSLVYYTDFGFGYLRIQSNGCLKALFR